MTQITVRIPDELVQALDAVAAQLKRSRAAVVRQAVERYLEDFEGLGGGGWSTFATPADPVLGLG